MTRPAPASAALRQAALTSMDGLKQAFFELDQLQRRARGYVASYRQQVPERVLRSGLVPRFTTLDERAEAVIGDYLATLDRFAQVGSPSGALPDSVLRDAYLQCADLTRLVVSVRDDLVAFLDLYDAELGHVATRIAAVGELGGRRHRALSSAASDWRRLAEEGWCTDRAEHLWSAAQAADRAAERWQPEAGLPLLLKRVEEVEAAAHDLASEIQSFPRRIEWVRQRIPSMHTLVTTFDHRFERMRDDLGSLRREFALPNWVDLDDSDDHAQTQLVRARSLLVELEVEVAAGTWPSALAVSADLEATVDSIATVLDGPRTRLKQLRAAQANPAALFERTRFRVRDAQILVVRGRVTDTANVRRRLDGMVQRIGALEPLLDVAHPDYRRMVTMLAGIEDEVEELVAEYRQRARVD